MERLGVARLSHVTGEDHKSQPGGIRPPPPWETPQQSAQAQRPRRKRGPAVQTDGARARGTPEPMVSSQDGRGRAAAVTKDDVISDFRQPRGGGGCAREGGGTLFVDRARRWAAKTKHETCFLVALGRHVVPSWPPCPYDWGRIERGSRTRVQDKGPGFPEAFPPARRTRPIRKWGD